MLLSIIEFPIVAMYILTGSRFKSMDKLISKLNLARKKSLDDYGKEVWIWEGYDGEESPYAFLERHRTQCNLLFIGTALVFALMFGACAHFGIQL